jgi:hypothetical protein
MRLPGAFDLLGKEDESSDATVSSSGSSVSADDLHRQGSTALELIAHQPTAGHGAGSKEAAGHAPAKRELQPSDFIKSHNEAELADRVWAAAGRMIEDQAFFKAVIEQVGDGRTTPLIDSLGNGGAAPIDPGVLAHPLI